MQTAQLLADLTEPQRQAVQHVDGPLLIIAAAGSGKTRVITRRVAYLVNLGIPAWSILAITFTNKAAGEMKHRISALSDRPVRDFGRLEQPWPMVCTFHSLCLRILRHYAETVGLPHNFTIYDAADQTKLIKDAIKSLDLSSTNFPPSQVHATISNAKNKLLTAEAFAQQAGDFYSRTIARVYTKYQAMLAANNALDFDDLLLRTAHALRDHPQVLHELQERFQYILIDEYQDTNHAQYILAHALAQRHKNLCVVGDPDQSIYAWRGADIQNILDFEKDYPDATVVKLEQNYRSTRTILHIAGSLIAHNTQRKDKQLWTENAQGSPADVILCQDEHDEARVVVERLRELNRKGRPWNQMAIFYRMNSLSRVIEEELVRTKTPYQVARGVEFYNRREIKDVLAYLRVIANPADEVSITRIINVPTRGLGDTSVKLISAYAAGHAMTLWEALQQPQHIAGLSTRAATAARNFVELVKGWQRLAARQPQTSGEMFGEVPKGTVQSVMEAVIRQSGIEAQLRKQQSAEKEEIGESATENLDALLSGAAEYDEEHPDGSLVDYLATISLLSDADHMAGHGGAITLMTLHAAKGLEFPVVAMIGMEEGVLPHARARGNMQELEEERRLCFVGITRAQEHLILSKAAYRTIRGLRERTVQSPFLNEMPPDAMTVEDRGGSAWRFDRGGNDDDRIPSSAERSAGGFRRGMLVRHPKFGLGRIADVSDMGSQTRAVVDFNEVGRKTLILEYARLEVVG